jgi:ABC-type Fe2+-enterobactin transport system substrate-binding protein
MCKSTTKVKQKKQKGHTSASSISSTSFTPDSVSLGQDNELLIYQDRPISQKTTNEQLKHIQGKEKVGEKIITNLLQQFKDILVEIKKKKTNKKSYVRAISYNDTTKSGETKIRKD